MAEAARTALYRRAVGFTYKSERVFANGRRMKVVEYVIPDVNAAVKILQAYDGDVWRDKKDVTGNADLKRARHRHQPCRSRILWMQESRSGVGKLQGRCSLSASCVCPSSQRSNSPGDVRMTGIALGWIAATIRVGLVPILLVG
jgi:hypothetical protein